MSTPTTEPGSGPGVWRDQGLVRSMGRMTLVALALNSMLGNAVFGLPALIATKLGAASVWAFLLGAFISGIFLVCFAELASRFTEAGGAYLYTRAALGRFPGIQIGWFLWLTRLSAAAASSNLFVAYLAEFWTPAGSRGVRITVLTFLLAFLGVVNLMGVGAGARLSNLFTAAKLVPLSIFILAGLAFVVSQHPHVAYLPPGRLAANWLDALLLLIYAYGGFDAALIPMSEAKNPRKDAPFALFSSMAILTLIFILVQIIVVRVLANPAATDRPLATAARQFLGTGGAVLMVVGAMISVYGHLTAYALHTPRLTFAFAQGGDFPALFGKVSVRFRTPYASILLYSAAVWGLAATGSYRLNAILSSASRLFVYAAACLAVMVLRRRNPGGAKFRVPGKDVIPIAGMALCLLLLTRIGRWEFVIIVAIALLALSNWLLVRSKPLGS